MTGKAAPKVAMLCGYVRQGFSGTQDFAERLSERLGDRFEVEWVDLPSWGLGATGALDAAVGRMRPDVVLMQYPTDAFRFGLAPHAFALTNRRAPLALTLHEFSAGHPLRKLSIGLIALRSAAVVVTTEAEKASLLRWYPWLAPRIRIVPIASNIPPREWRPGDGFGVAFFGQIRPHKGVEAFVDCAEAARAEGRDWRFRLLGSVQSQHREFFDALQPRIRAAGIELVLDASPDEIADELSAAHAALLDYPDGATLRRGSLLAAASCGTPIVTRHTAETPPIVAGATASASSTAEAMERLTRLAEDAGYREELHRRAVAIARETSWDTVTGGYASTLSELADR